MNIYTRAIHFKNGDIHTITEQELHAIQGAILQGKRWVMVQGELISADTIARIGSHHASAEIALRERANGERALLMAGKADEVDERRRLLAEAVIRQHTPEPALTRKRAVRGERKDILYWQDEYGERHYS